MLYDCVVLDGSSFRSAILTFTFAAGHLGAFTPYAFLANDLVAQAALYTHHQYIGGFFMCGAFAQVALNTLAGVRPLRALDRTRACNVLG